MKIDSKNKSSIDDHVGCFGNFNVDSPICKKLCVLNISCAVERTHNERMEILEDLVSSDDMSIKIQ